MNTPTPRTDAAWSSSFEPCEYRAAHTARTMRECSQQLETELAALTAERDQLRVDLELADVMYQRECEVEHELRTEVERLRSDRDCEKRLRKDADEFRENAIARAERAEASLHAATEECTDVRLKWHAVMGACAAKEDAIMESDEELARLRARAERAEDNLAALEQSFDDNCRGVAKIADDLTAATAEVARLKRDYEYDHKCLHEVRERCESWKQRAERAEAELAKAKERLRSEAMDDYAAIKDLQRDLAAERARLDSGQIMLIVAGERVWHSGVDLRAAIDAAMKEDAK